MKILIFNWQDIKNPLAGGAEVHLHEIFSRIAKMGHEVTLYCSSFKGARSEETINGIRVVREGGRYFFNFRVPFRYFTRFRHNHYDVIIDDMNKIPFFTSLYVQRRLFVLVHHLFGKSIFRETIFPFALYVYVMEQAGVEICRTMNSAMMAVSPSTQHELTSRGFRATDISIVPNCTDHERYHPTGISRSSKPLIGYMGRLKRYKSVDHLLEAFASLRRKNTPDLELLIIGDGDDKPRLENIAKQLGVSNAVRFTGFVGEEEKVRLLQEVWFVVNTSSKEGWGLTVIEANACGTTVLASDVPGLRDAVKNDETGLLYEYGNIKQLEEKILLLLRDGALRQRLESSAMTWAKTFDWNIVAKKTIELLQQHTHNS